MRATTAAAYRKAVDLIRALIWWFYRDLKAYKRDPNPGRAKALRVLERPEIPLHTNGSEDDIRAWVTKRKISGGAVSQAGKAAHDTMLGLIKTCAKLDLSFYQFLGDRFAVPNAPSIPQPAIHDQTRRQLRPHGILPRLRKMGSKPLKNWRPRQDSNLQPSA